MIKVFCDICKNECVDEDFVFEATKAEVIISFADKQMTPQKKMQKQMIQICKGCYSIHISKLFNNEKD